MTRFRNCLLIDGVDPPQLVGRKYQDSRHRFDSGLSACALSDKFGWVWLEPSRSLTRRYAARLSSIWRAAECNRGNRTAAAEFHVVSIAVANLPGQSGSLNMTIAQPRP